jgi:glucosamine-phosphate N-acetyltransferase
MRLVQDNDYEKGYCELLSVLTKTSENISKDKFEAILQCLGNQQQIWVLEEAGKIICTMTLLMEPKLIHNGSSILHIEDVIVHPDHQKKGLGKMMMDAAKQIAIENNCYKIILDCTEQNKKFYESCGFSSKQIQMSYYF